MYTERERERERERGERENQDAILLDFKLELKDIMLICFTGICCMFIKIKRKHV